MVPPLFLHEHREAGCFSVLPDRKFYRVGNLFIKRTMRRHEWQKMSRTWVVTPSASIPQRYRNDVAIQQYLRERTNIPLPHLPRPSRTTALCTWWPSLSKASA